MFVLTKVKDTIKVNPHDFGKPTHVAVHSEIDVKYPNRVLLDAGLVICRYGDCSKIGLGSCVPGEGFPHHECVFQLVVFRPFIDEVIVGHIVKSTEEGIQVSLGFFQDIYIPAYWMLNPTSYEKKTGLWVWTPTDENEEEEDDDDDDDQEAEAGENGNSKVAVKEEQEEKTEEEEGEENGAEEGEGEEEEEDENRFEMEIGAEIRFKVKGINYTRATNSFKTKGGTSSSSSSTSKKTPAPSPMVIVGSICEDGLGLTSWWDNEEEEEGEGEEGEAGEEEEEGGGEEEEEVGEEEEVNDDYDPGHDKLMQLD